MVVKSLYVPNANRRTYPKKKEEIDMVHQNEAARLMHHYVNDCGGSIEGLKDVLVQQLQMRASVGGILDPDRCLTRLNGGCWDCEEIACRFGILERVIP